MDFTAIGKRIKVARKNAGITQEQLAERIDISTHYVYEIERGLKKLSLRTLTNIAIELQQSMDYLLWGNYPPYSEEFAAEPDPLSEIIDEIPFSERNTVAEIISTMLPHIGK